MEEHERIRLCELPAARRHLVSRLALPYVTEIARAIWGERPLYRLD